MTPIMSYAISLPPLTNIIDTIDPISEFTEEDLDEFRESIYLIIDDFIKKNVIEYMYYDFEKRVFEHTYTIVEMLYEEVIDSFKGINISELVEEGMSVYFSLLKQPRSYPGPYITTPKDAIDIQTQIQKLRNIPQPPQNTPGWFDFRWTRLTASSAWKALDSDAKRNEIIYGKCKPIDKAKYSRVNTKSAMHHGHKYEPISTIFYEDLFDTEIEEFGCLPDEFNVEFGASPDGINVKRGNQRYGYLLEIKNPVSRKLTGVPKREYWVQMQFQMHVTGLKTCDFLETVFKEYDTEEDSKKDGTFNKTPDNKQKGVIVCFSDGYKPIYHYSPWNCTESEFDEWYDQLLDSQESVTWIQNIYWKLTNYSCVTVSYNEDWFTAVKPIFEDLWKIVVAERVSGYDHRKPKSRAKKPPISSPLIDGHYPKFPPPPLIDIEPPKIVLKINTFNTTFKN
jgi:hypothetical protein|tara:strand:+ start:8493 stop:9845 length:1353 start_codon:yes stop_codon:yes gene_type:complete